MTNLECQSPKLTQKILFYSSEISFVKTSVDKYLKENNERQMLIKQIEKLEKIIKIIKRHVKVKIDLGQEQKMTDLELIEIYESSFQYIEQRLRELIYPVKLLKSDFELYMIKRYVKLNQKTCGITMSIDTEKNDDRVIIQTNLTEIIDIEYHRFTVKSLLLKTSEILKNFKYHPITYESNLEVDLLIHQIVKNYNIVPYHNFTHAFSVFQLFYYFSNFHSVKKHLTDFELYFSLVACLCHDLRHSTSPLIIDGLNSIFQTKVKSELATNFGNISILQKMHTSVTFQILEGLGQNSPLQTVNKEQRRKAKHILVSCILSTDMVIVNLLLKARHYDYVSRLNQKKLQLSREEDRQFLIESLVHGCDIGNSMFDYENYIIWANLVCVQFHEQTLKEEANGLQITGHMRFESLNYFYKNQSSFINSVVLPMWQAVNTQLQQKKIEESICLIRQNGKKVSAQMIRKSDCSLKNSIARSLGSLLKELNL